MSGRVLYTIAYFKVPSGAGYVVARWRDFNTVFLLFSVSNVRWDNSCKCVLSGIDRKEHCGITSDFVAQQGSLAFI